MGRFASPAALPGTPFAVWLAEMRGAQSAAETRAGHIRMLLGDASVAGRVQAGLDHRPEIHPTMPPWLADFVRENDGSLSLQFRLGAARRRAARLRREVYAGASDALLNYLSD